MYLDVYKRQPLYFLLVASFLNIGLDLLCIIVFKMGVFGAAFATVFSQAVAGLGSLWYILKHYNELRWNKEESRLSRQHCVKPVSYTHLRMLMDSTMPRSPLWAPTPGSPPMRFQTIS